MKLLQDVESRLTEGDDLNQSLPATFAHFVKLTSLLPPTNERVRRSAVSFLSELSQMHEHALAVTLKIDRGRVTIGETVTEAEYNPNLRWLLEHLERAGVATIEFRATVNTEALFAFCRQLVANGNSRSSTVLFTDFWPEEYQGLRLTERRFDGAFPVQGVSGGASQTKWKTSSRQGQMLAEILDSDPGLHIKLVQLQALIDRAAEADERALPRKRVDIIGRVVNLLPAEALARPQRIKEVAETLLQHLTSELDAPGQADRDNTVDHMLLRLSRKFFYREDSGGDRIPEDDTAEDVDDIELEEVPETSSAEDVGTVLEEIIRCGGEWKEVRLSETPGDEGEPIGVLLHFLVQLKDEDSAARMANLLVPLLQQAPAAGREIIAPFVQHAVTRFESWRQTRILDRLSYLLGDSRLASLAAEADLFSVEEMTRLFPAIFLPYLDWMDLSDRRQVWHLEVVCGALGAGRLLDSQIELEKSGGLERDRRAEKILANPRKSFLPLLHMILRKNGSRLPEVAKALCELELERPEAIPLKLCEETGKLPAEYLLKLTSGDDSAEARADLRTSVTRILVQIASQDEGVTDRRLVAISRLGAIGGAEAETALREIAGSRRWLVVPNEPAEIRKAARHALARHDG